ncbi:MAG: DNA adenine methylase [Synechococcales bacterium]|nr:DNA adenine methylase [Synechococcales bacterium]
MGKIIAFGWYGGKFNHLNWLLPLLPEATHYCEPFAGSAAVLLNRKPSPVETYNDIDGEVVNFFRVLRDSQEELIKAIGLTPFSREELRLAVEESVSNLSELERARRFFVRARQVRTGLAQTASVGRWAHCKLTSRAGMAGAVSRWLGSVEGLSEIVQRLLRVQIENSPAIEVIRRYDHEETLFYCDPPYPHISRGDANAYKYEMTDDEHRRLAEVLKNTKGKVALSGYHCDLLDTLYGDWYCIEAPSKQCLSVKQLRTEVVWMNYAPPKDIADSTEWLNQEKSSLPLFDALPVGIHLRRDSGALCAPLSREFCPALSGNPDSH